MIVIKILQKKSMLHIRRGIETVIKALGESKTIGAKTLLNEILCSEVGFNKGAGKIFKVARQPSAIQGIALRVTHKIKKEKTAQLSPVPRG
jgi:hypothetical protein